jgi:hypothetical protein
MSEATVQGTLFGEEPAGARMLTVQQPWAWTIIHAGKDVENRKQYCSFRGLLIIHAGKKVDPKGVEFLRSIGIEPPAEALQGGHIVGQVEVTGCVAGSPSRWAQDGLWHIQVASPQAAARKVAARGNLGLQKPPAGWELAFA